MYCCCGDLWMAVGWNGSFAVNRLSELEDSEASLPSTVYPRINFNFLLPRGIISSVQMALLHKIWGHANGRD